jgi:uncharacterized membrane-anchored protein YitT (DUF2179 family)
MPEINSQQAVNRRVEKARLRRLGMRNAVKNVAFLIAGVGSAAIGLKGFLLPAHFLDGGVTGISLLIERLTGWNISVLILLINVPFILIGRRQVSNGFAIKTASCITALALALAFLPVPLLTQDRLLIAVFGGFFIGAGIGLSMRGGGVIDGTEVMAIFISRHSSLTVGDVIALFNIVLFACSALLFSFETALYSMLTYLAASKTVDFLITGIEEYIGVTIVSEKADAVKHRIVNKLGRAVTVFRGDGGFGKKGLVEEKRSILFSVVTRLEVQRMIVEIEKVDPNAFVVQHTVNDTRGGMIKKRPLH